MDKLKDHLSWLAVQIADGCCVNDKNEIVSFYKELCNKYDFTYPKSLNMEWSNSKNDYAPLIKTHEELYQLFSSELKSIGKKQVTASR